MGGNIYTLQRLTQSSEGTFGILKDESGTILCHTLELPWNDNHPQTSCIPSGQYECTPHNGEKWKNVWELQNVPGRSGILIHAGNYAAGNKIDTDGCILVGMSQGWIGTQQAILNSLEALNYLRNTLPSTFSLCIIDPT